MRCYHILVILVLILLMAGCTSICRRDYGGYDPNTRTVVVTNRGVTATLVSVTVSAFDCVGELLGTGVGYANAINAGESRVVTITDGDLPQSAPKYTVSEDWTPAIR